MKIELNIPDDLWVHLSLEVEVEWRCFLQAATNRVVVGSQRYGIPTKKKKYMTRLSKELQAYKKEGNAEQLFNIAVYAFLESFAPENKKFHFNAYAKSVTRKEMGGNIT